MKKILYFIHGILLAIGSPIVLYGHVISGAFYPPSSVVKPAIIFLCLYLLVFLLIFLILRNAGTSGLTSTIFILGILYQWPVFISIILISSMGLAIIFLLKKRINLLQIHSILTIVSSLLIGVFLVLFFLYVVSVPWRKYREMTAKMVDMGKTDSSQSSTPDVYYIILDGYARADVLQDLYGFDNLEFIQKLEQRGFYVAPESKSNYPRTLLSLASSLNMKYLDPVSETMGDSSLLWPLSNMIQQSAVRSFFKGIGYKTVFFSNEWEYSDIRDGDVYIHTGITLLNNLTGAIIDRTNLLFIANLFPPSFLALPNYVSHRDIILNDFAQLPQVAKMDGPKFVFAHILAPHPPFVFDAEGNAITPDYPYSLLDAQELFHSTQNYENLYLDQLNFINKLTIQMIDGIQKYSKTPPIIIMQADHGPAIIHYYFSVDELSTYERYSILNAFYLPGIGLTDIPPDITPVNSFRFVLNKYFQGTYELLPNRQYFPSEMVLYQFQDVTNMGKK